MLPAMVIAERQIVSTILLGMVLVFSVATQLRIPVLGLGLAFADSIAFSCFQ